MERFQDKNILITGGSSGMGKATAQRVTQEGGTAIINGRKLDRLESARQDFEHPERVIPVEGDVSSLEALKKMYDTIASKVGKLDGIFVNAGFGLFKATPETTEDDFEKIFAVNVKGAFFTIQQGLNYLKRPASVVINASWTSHRGLPNACLYGATKAAVQSMARTLTSEFGSEGLRFNSVSPGFIDTSALQKVGMSDEERNFWKKRIPEQHRLADPAEVASVVAFLLSDDARYVASEDFLIDGGFNNTVSME